MKKLEALAAAIKKEIPVVDVHATGECVEITIGSRTITIPKSAVRARVGGKRERARLIDAKEPFVDLASGVLHINDGNTFILVTLDLVQNHLTPFAFGIMARLCEEYDASANLSFPLTGAALRRHLKILTGLELTEMSVQRFLKTARGLGVIKPKGKAERFDRQAALDTIAAEFDMDRIGVSRRFAIADASAIGALVTERFPSCIHGLSRVVTSGGIHSGEDDLIATRELEPELRRRFGPPVDASYRGKTAVVRFTNKAPPAIFAGGATPLQLNPILAAAHAMKTETEMRGVGESLWRRLTR